MNLHLALTITSIVISALAIVLLVVVLRLLRTHRTEIRALRRMTERGTGEPLAPGAADPDADAGADGAAARLPERPRRIAVVVNPSKFASIERFREQIRTVVASADGADLVFHETSIEDPGAGQARRAVEDGADLVVAAGGDGTVRQVASVLAGTEVRMGIIPAGTGNLLARNLEVPLEDPAGAMTAALTGTDRRIDVGWLRTGMSLAAAAAAAPQVFLVIAGFGADAEMIGHTDPTMKRRIGWLAYVLGGARTILGRSVDVVLDLGDGERHAHKARTVLLGNVGKLPGGLVLMPDATVDNGLLSVVVAGWRGAAGFSQVLTEVVSPWLVPPKRFRLGSRLSTMERYQSAQARVATTRAQPVQLDGDTDIEATTLLASIDAAALTVRAPARPAGRPGRGVRSVTAARPVRQVSAG